MVHFFMTSYAFNFGMSAYQCKTCSVMIEFNRVPTVVNVAAQTIVVIPFPELSKVNIFVAAFAIQVERGKFIGFFSGRIWPHMASGAGSFCMFSQKRKLC